MRTVLRNWNWRRFLIISFVTFIGVYAVRFGSPYVSLEVLGWCWAAFLAVFAVAMLLFVVVDELNFDYGDER